MVIQLYQQAPNARVKKKEKTGVNRVGQPDPLPKKRDDPNLTQRTFLIPVNSFIPEGLELDIIEPNLL